MAAAAGRLQRRNEEQQTEQGDELDDLLEDYQLQQYFADREEIELKL